MRIDAVELSVVRLPLVRPFETSFGRMSAREFVLVAARQDGMIVTSRQLLREAWGPDRVGDSGALRVCVKGLRDKLEPDPRRPQFLVTEPGIGYRLRATEPDEA